MISVLYVDDEAALLEVAKIFLEDMGQFHIDTVTSARGAQALLSEKDYDAIVSDYQMPVMDGIGLLRKVRSAGNTVPFILFTGKGREEIVIQALNEGADFYLQKGGEPTSQFTELAYKIRQAVQQRRAEAAVRDHERREAEILNFLPDATFAIDIHGIVIAWNRAMEDFTGIPASEILGKGDYEYALPLYHERRPVLIDLVLHDDPAVEARYSYVLRSGRKLFSEVTLPERNNGNGMLIWFTASPLYDEKGRVIGAIESIRDITERRMAEERIRESESRYRDVVETQTEFVSRFRPDGTHVFVNEAYCRHFGMKREEIIGHRFVPEIPEEDKPAVRDHFASLTRENPVASIEHRVIMPDGSIRWHFWNDHAIFDNEGRLVEYQSVGKDITERKDAEEAIRLSEQKFSAAFDATPFPMAITNLENGQIQDINRAFEEWSGFSRADVRGSSTLRLNMWVHPEERDQILTELMNGNVVQNKEVTLRKRDGKERTMLLSGSRFHVGGRTYMFSLAEDVTESKRTAAALKDSETLFKSLVESIQDPMVILSFEGTILFANPAALALMGFSALPEADSISIARYLDSCSHEPAFHDLQQLKRSGQAMTGEYYLIHPDGSRHCVEACGVRIQYRGKAADLVSLRDVTERKQVTSDLKEAEQRLTGIINFLPDATFAIDTCGIVIAWNRAIEEMTGVMAKDIIGKGNYEYSIPFYGVRRPILIDLVSHDDAEIRKNYSFVRRDGDVLTAETKMTRPDKTLYLWGKAGPLYNSWGEITGAIESIRDISDWRGLEESVKKKSKGEKAGT